MDNSCFLSQKLWNSVPGLLSGHPDKTHESTRGSVAHWFEKWLELIFYLQTTQKAQEAMHSHLMEKWHTIHRRHERGLERLYKLYHEQKEELSPERAHAVEGDKEDAYVQWMDSEQQLKDIQEQLRDLRVDSEMQSLRLINEECKKLLVSSHGSPQPDPHQKGRPVNRAESEVSRYSHAPSQWSHADPSHVSGKASSFRHMSKAHSSVSQHSHITGPSRHSKASRQSHASRASRAESIAARLREARINTAMANIAAEAAVDDKLHREDLAKAQANFEIFQRQQRAKEAAAIEAILQRELEDAMSTPNLESLGRESSHSRVQAYVDNQSALQNAQMRAPQPARSPPRLSRRTEESQRPDSLVNCRVDVTTPRS
ncbi:uncharacterized protein LOC120298097 isoform X2 [Crotalus tigris]|uniref:uncharacterized protein LOC120298097 isoform X2 n=1 Tax=Crotalus tigris TaxID=88082 RepID=UPI00192F9DCB|nr:uncharacterized protein LOC120298097 isoform X2 [Crotalus tigris]